MAGDGGNQIADDSQVEFREDAEGQLLIPVPEPPAGAGEGSSLLGPLPHSEDRPPRLRRLWFKSFKGFDDFELTVGNFNVIAGANNAGKSTMLQGVDLIFSLIKLHSEGNHLAEGRLVPPGVLPVAAGKDLFFNGSSRIGNVYVQVVLGAEFADGSNVEFSLRHMFGNFNSQVSNQAGLQDERLAALLAHPAVWVPSSVGIVRDEEYRPPARQRGLIIQGRHNEVLRNLLVEVRTNHEDKFATLQGVLSERFGGTVGDADFDGQLDQFVRGTYQADAGMEHDLYSSGAGFVQVLQMLTFIFAQDPSVVLLDEPDAHLHSSLQRVVIEILDDLSRSEGFQVLMATHSKEIINFVDPTRLILIEPGADSASLVTAEVTPISVLKSLGAIDNVDAYSLVKNRRCLFVEGASDATILGRFGATLGMHDFTGDERVVTLPVGGADKFEHVAQLDVFESLLGDELASLQILDGDSRLDEYRQRILGRHPRPLHILNLDCIESYLIRPPIMAKVIAEILDERSSDKGSPTVSEVETMIEAAAEDLRQVTEDRIAERISQDTWRFDNKHVSVPKAMGAAREFVADHWVDLESKLRVLPGKKLLSAIRRKVQDDYGINFGNERLAEAFDSEDIQPELIDVLHKISSL